MSNIKNILTATDLSDRTDGAVHRAAMLAAEHNATLQLLHVVREMPLSMARRLLAEVPGDFDENLIEPVRKQVEEIAVTLRSEYGATVEPTVSRGRPSRCILEQAEKTGSDLIVIGPHRQNIARNVIMGTTAQNLVRTAECAVLIVKNEPADEYNRVLVPVDFSDHARQAVLEAIRMAPGATIYVENIFEVPYEHYALYGSVADDAMQSFRSAAEKQARSDMDAFMADLKDDIRGASVEAAVHPGYAPVDIDRRAETLGAELIVMGAFGQSEISYALLGSVTVSVMLHTRRDLLAIRT